MKDFVLTSLRGGLNVQDPPSVIDGDQCVAAENVVFDEATVGARRLGCRAINTGGTFAGMTEAVFVFRHLPTTDEADAQLWVWATNANSGTSILAYKDTTWHVVTVGDALNVTYRYQIRAQTLNSKLFIAYRSTVDRLHVWDGTSLRRTGLAQPSPPTGANVGAAGPMTGKRYYRFRYVTQVAGITKRRSEPSTSLTITAIGASITVTRSALISEGETHWEIEASVDNNLFYRISTILVATTTFSDSTVYGTGYAPLVGAVLSEDIGDYDLLHSAKILSVDQNRLITAGSFENTLLTSRVVWTPVFNAPGVSNDERSPIDEDNFLDLDTSEGGQITDLSRTVNSYIMVFKRYHIYRLTRTGLRTKAYESFAISKDHGALNGSVVDSTDQSGGAALYFLDERIGPCRISASGMKVCGYDILKLWKTLNVNATVNARSVNYPDRRQIRWCIATGSATLPNFGITLQVNDTRDTDNGVRKGWTTASGPSTTALSMALFPENVDDGVARSLRLKPILGIPGTGSDLVQLADTGNTDNSVAYTGTVTTHAYIPVGLLSKFGVRAAAILAKSAAATDVTVSVIRDFAIETKPFTVSLVPVGSEVDIVRWIDQLNLSECIAIQIKVSDGPSVKPWAVNGISLKPRTEDGS